MSREAVGDHDRMIASMVKTGEVVAVDLKKAMIRIKCGDWVSPFVRWHSASAGKARHWRAPSLGESGTLFSPSGVPQAARFMGGVYGDGGTAPDDRDHVEVWEFDDGGRIVYDWQAKTYDITVPSGTVTIKVGASTVAVTDNAVAAKTTTATVEATNIAFKGNVSIEGNLSVKGNVDADGTIMDKGGNSPNHKH